MRSRVSTRLVAAFAATTTAVTLLTGPAAAAPSAPAAPAAPEATAVPAGPTGADRQGAGTEDRTPATAPAAQPLVAEVAAHAAAEGEEAPAAGTVAAREVGVAPFELLGVTLDEPAHPVLVRVRQGGRWGGWHELGFDGDAVGDDAPVADRPGATSAPLWVGPSDGYEVLLPPGAGEPTVHLVRGGAGPTGGLRAAAVTAAAAAPSPTFAASPGVHSRTEWGARPFRGVPSEATDLRLAFVHHSVSVNGYSAAAVPGMLRSIQAFHMDANGWSDAGYNFAVDRFGRIWEFRAGGIVNAVIGGHAQGFNTSSVGVVLLGDYTSVGPTSAALNAVAEIIAWRFAVAQTDPRGLVDYRTVSGSTRFPPGTIVRINGVSGHRDVGLTACPGTLGYAQMGTIRSRVGARFAALRGTTITRWLTSPTQRYGDLRGRAIGTPDVVATGSDGVDVYVRGEDGQLWRNEVRDGDPSPWGGLGGLLTSSPSAVTTGDETSVFARGADGAVWYRTRSGGTWSAWGTLGGRLTSAPEVAAHANGSLVLVGRGGDGAVWTRARDAGGDWGPWTTLGGGVRPGAALGLVLGSDVGEADVLITGGDGALWSRRGPIGSPAPWVRVGGGLTSGVSAAVSDEGRYAVIGRGGDGRLWSVQRVDGAWGGWQQVSRERVAEGAGLASWGSGGLDLATTTPDGRIFHHPRAAGAGW